MVECSRLGYKVWERTSRLPSGFAPGQSLGPRGANCLRGRIFQYIPPLGSVLLQSRIKIKNLLVIHMSHLDHPLLLNIDILFPQSFNCPPVGGNFCAILQHPCSLRLWKTYLMRSLKTIRKPSEEKIRCTQLRYSLLWQQSHQGRKLAGPSFWSR